MDFAVATTVIDAAGNAGIPVNLRGGPGIGKTSAVAAVAAGRDRHLETVLASVREPADFAGLPIIAADGSTVFAPPRWARTVVEHDKASIVFFDELSTAPPAVQAATLRVLTERWVGDLELPPTVWFVAAMNPVDVAAGGWDLTAPLANRLLHLDVSPNIGDWTEGMLTGWGDSAPEMSDDPSDDRAAATVGQVTGFVSAHPEHFNACPQNPAEASGAWPSPRTWDYVTRVLPRIRADHADAISGATTGLVGAHAAAEFLTWVDESDLPDPSKVIADPNIVDWDDRGDRLIAVLHSAVAFAATAHDKDTWTAAETVIAAAVANGKEDIAAGVIKPLIAAGRTVGAKVDPKIMKQFAPLLERAGKIT